MVGGGSLETGDVIMGLSRLSLYRNREDSNSGLRFTFLGMGIDTRWHRLSNLLMGTGVGVGVGAGAGRYYGTE